MKIFCIIFVLALFQSDRSWADTYVAGTGGFDEEDCWTPEHAAISRCDQAAREGNTFAQLIMGERYRDGLGVPQNLFLAKNYFLEAAEQDDGAILMLVGILLGSKYSEVNDVDAGLEWLIRLSNSTDEYYKRTAVSWLAGTHYWGWYGVERDTSEAAHWIKLGAELGDPESLYLLGNLYRSGTEVPQNYALARETWHRGAELGSVRAAYSLGLSLVNDDHGDTDFNAAMYWMLIPVRNNDAMAQYMLGRWFEHGIGVPQNYETAHMWYNIAAAGSNAELFRSMRDGLASSMTNEQIARAQARASSCMASDFQHSDCQIPDVSLQ
ncbi:tetratricopeptide repeat protein [Roseovarius sp. 10]|uniref:tetratricopeptide repeat protein n=1 Tax=Roseovarius sp. 10 TaxID=3080563 RepID=UPI0029547F84|nr:tetratricopeptide repeat protein [Roseovarius sp. 10]MDV7201103.1 tetratricopeptide repeat protein [Roseovarius sp. 10]